MPWAHFLLARPRGWSICAVLLLFPMLTLSAPAIAVASGAHIAPHPQPFDLPATASAALGVTDPQGAPVNYTVFADHELFLPYVDPTQNITFRIAMPGPSLALTSTVDLQGDVWELSNINEYYGDAGRITEQTYD